MSECINVKDWLPDEDDANAYFINGGNHCFVGAYRHDAKARTNFTTVCVQERYADGTFANVVNTRWMTLPVLPMDGVC